MTPQWCERQAIIFENLHVSRFWHVDRWLADRVAKGEEKELQILNPLAGYGHRMSQTQGQAGSRFGGAWLPPPPDKPNHSFEEREARALAMSPEFVRDWATACKRQNPTIARGDVAPYVLTLPKVPPAARGECGVYSLGVSGDIALALRVPLHISMCSVP